MRNQRKLQVFFPLLLSAVLALGMFFGFKLRDSYRVKGNIFRIYTGGSGAAQEIINLVNAKYVDSVSSNELNTSAVRAILDHLDPHSVYIRPSELQQVNDDLQGNFGGIGVEFIIYQDTLNVVHVMENGPSAKAGLQDGDRIVKVEDTLIAGNHTSVDRIQALLRGPNGSRVNITIARNGKLQPVAIQRGMIPIYSIDASYMVNNNTGYIRINKFAATTYDEFMKALTGLQEKGMKKLIIDLRNNPGGFMDAAIKIADELLDDKKLILYTQGQHYPRANYYCEKPGIFEQGPLTILVNEESASASEILAGAIQDWDRGTIIGRRTFGKGLVQEQYPLSSGGALRLTIARYYMPSGRCIQKSYDHGTAAYDEDIMDRYNHGELLSKDSIKIIDTIRYETMVKHRTVYGGEGIIPDIFVPYDTTRFNRLLSHLYAGNAFGEFAYVYYSRHKEEFAQYHSPRDFNARFEVTDKLLQDFMSVAGRDSIPALPGRDSYHIRLQIKAFIARQIWQGEGYYEVNNAADAVFKKAVAVLDTAQLK